MADECGSEEVVDLCLLNVTSLLMNSILFSSLFLQLINKHHQTEC